MKGVFSSGLILVLSLLHYPLVAKESFEENIQQIIRAETKYENIQNLMKAYHVPGLSLAVIRDRNIVWLKGYGVKQSGSKDKINSDTLFSVGSISKVGTAVVTLKQVDLGRFKLDADINQYLTSWKVPESRYNKQSAVTLRRILSHTAGFNVHGFADFQPGESLPKTVDILTGKYPAKSSPVRLIFEPGSSFKYSGGGTTVQQMLLEDTLGKDFASLTQEQLFKPLGMNRSTYLNPVPNSLGNIAKAHDRSGRPRALPRGYEAMPEQAASGLWTTPGDLSKLIITLMQAYDGHHSSFISQKLAREMMIPVEPSEFGLGPVIVDKTIFQHGGANDSYKAFFQGNLQTGDGYVIFTNSASGRGLINQLKVILNKLID